MRLWISGLSALDVSLDGSAGESRYERDLPHCCRTEASRLAHANATDVGEVSGMADYFECTACGLARQRPSPGQPELDAFGYHDTGEMEEAA